MPHIHTGDGQFDFTVTGFVIYENTILLIKHKYLPYWLPPGGHIELNQTPVDALFDEISQEAGIDTSHLELIETTSQTKNLARGESSVVSLPFDIEHHAITDTHRHIALAYIVKSDTNDVAPGAGESNTFKWFTADELSAFQDTNDSIKNLGLYALDYIAKQDS